MLYIYIPSMTPNFKFCNKYCVITNLIASSDSAASTMDRPKKDSSGVYVHVVDVPIHVCTYIRRKI